jgi:hypothetical protein
VDIPYPVPIAQPDSATLNQAIKVEVKKTSFALFAKLTKDIRIMVLQYWKYEQHKKEKTHLPPVKLPLNLTHNHYGLYFIRTNE